MGPIPWTLRPYTNREIRRSGRARVFDGRRHTDAVYRYKLPEEWALVP